MRTSRFGFVAVVCLIVACGGGGEAGPVALTSENSEAVALQAVSTDAFMEFVTTTVDHFTDVVEPEAATILCSSGSAQVNVNDVGPEGMSTGDFAEVVLNACDIDEDGFQASLNGALRFTATEVVGSEGEPFSLVLDCSFSNLTITAFGATINIDGAFTMDVSSTDGVNIVSVVSGERLSAFVAAPGQSLSRVWTDFRHEATLDTSTDDYTYRVDGTVFVSELNGTLTFETVVPFQGTVDADPHTGTLVVTGAEGATLTLTALDAVNVRLELDLNDDGTPEVTVNTTWAALHGAEA